jgi:death-on-curing protein
VSVDYLTLEDLLALTRDLGAGPVRDVGLLGSAVARPSTAVFGQEAYATLPLKAAALLHSIVNNRALVDGNKRLGWLATAVFLDINGLRVTMSHDEAFDLVMAVASGALDDVTSIAEALDAGTASKP